LSKKSQKIIFIEFSSKQSMAETPQQPSDSRLQASTDSISQQSQSSTDDFNANKNQSQDSLTASTELSNTTGSVLDPSESSDR
jgi:hypothetical protein